LIKLLDIHYRQNSCAYHNCTLGIILSSSKENLGLINCLMKEDRPCPTELIFEKLITFYYIFFFALRKELLNHRLHRLKEILVEETTEIQI
jgi:hypothetical protein